MNLGNIARVVTVAAACLAALGSATSNNNSPGVQPQNANMSPPPPQEMDPARALGLWRSTFGAVKIEADNTRGGIASGAVQGIWVYQRRGQEVIGYFNGSLRGNVLDFKWQEPGSADAPPLVGAGYLAVDARNEGIAALHGKAAGRIGEVVLDVDDEQCGLRVVRLAGETKSSPQQACCVLL